MVKYVDSTIYIGFSLEKYLSPSMKQRVSIGFANGEIDYLLEDR